ncbi:PREDICTED: uncharacterized protein LOC104814715 [Tarenaya hassleriana]|uniref:uncharacterized protein LOC104814715 n=1 Tax=Tarenaya hassleriana TaxID=28532 RepID=UPI00053C1CC6|nr:PREDICTED: uncharacterized protein LOC104814715 [Tarenaya hassleriana]
MDNPQKLIPIVLNGDNYFYWTKAATAALNSKGLWDHVVSQKGPSPQVLAAEGETAEQTALRQQQTDADFNKKWKQADSQALVILQGSLEPHILQSFISNDTAKSLWESLQSVYGNLSNISRIFELKKQLFHLQQHDQPFNKIQGEFCALWAELEEIRPTSTDPKIVMERAQEDKVFSILLTLNASFNHLVYHLLRQIKLPTFEEVCMMVKREEGGHNLFAGPHELAHYTQKSHSAPFPRRDRREFFCDHCRRNGHSKERCWVLNPHLKPPKFKDNSRKGTAMTAAHVPSPTENGISLTSEEMKGLKHLLQSLHKDTGNFTFHSDIVIDSGATTHMFKDANLFHTIFNGHGFVSVANGKNVSIKGYGY